MSVGDTRKETARGQTKALLIIALQQTIRDTFSLEDVPRQAYYMGMAGVIPYAATSLSTVFCAYEISSAATSGHGLLFNEKTAELLLHVIEPLQVGYGAVVSREQVNSFI